MGLGKSLAGVQLAAMLSQYERVPKRLQSDYAHPNRTLVLCPASLLINWKEEFKMWLPEDVSHKVGKISIVQGCSDPDTQRSMLYWKEHGGVIITTVDTVKSMLQLVLGGEEEEDEEQQKVKKKSFFLKKNLAKKFQKNHRKRRRTRKKFQTRLKLDAIFFPSYWLITLLEH